MTTSKKPKWKKFEELAVQIHSELSPTAHVTSNEHIMGRRSKVKRQIDICIRQSVGPHEIIIVIDCKDHKTPLDVKEIEEFIGLVDDVGANKGAMISVEGFTKTAKTRAKDAGLDLYRLVDAESEDWRSYVSIPALAVMKDIKQYNFAIRVTGYCAFSEDPRIIMAHDANGNPIETLYDRFVKKWNHGEIPSEQGMHSKISFFDDKTFVKTKEILSPARFEVNYEVTPILYFGQLRLIDVKGLHNQHTGALHTKGFTTEAIDLEKIRREWLELQDEQQLAVEPLTRPILRIFTSVEYPLWDGTFEQT